MSALKLVLAPSPILKNKCDPINGIDKSILKLASDMFEIMYKFKGVGLAAPQIGKSIQLLVIDCSKSDETFFPEVVINPKIFKVSSNLSYNEEGCLSFPKQFYEIERPDYVLVEYTNIKGKTETKKFTGFEAVCIQHEIDHLSGTLFVDYMSKLRRNMILKKMKKYKKLSSAAIS